ncbi:hypothetical protein M422DRAFT_243775 [Sphaerobolus stellatus SS14]|nr:hypothetical protein M422DRAFT_243775 [Sphaerobolus stellatus SS14]
MSMHRNRKRAEELTAPAVGEVEPLQGLTTGKLMDLSPSSVDPQQSSEVFDQEHLGDPTTRVHGPQTVPRWPTPIGMNSKADSGHNLIGAPDEYDHASPDEGGTENEDGSFTIKASEADSDRTLDANAQYWSDLSNKATCYSHRALELQLKMAEEKVNTLLYEEAPEKVLLEAAQEACNIHFQLDQNMCLHEAGLMPEQ